MKYKKLPVEIEAFRLGFDNMPEWFVNHKDLINIEREKRIDGNIKTNIKTLEGIITANKGDYIILGVKSEIYPCRADIFEATYEVAK